MVLLAVILLAFRPSLLTHDNRFLPLFSALRRTDFGRIKPHPASPWVQATKGMYSLTLMVFLRTFKANLYGYPIAKLVLLLWLSEKAENVPPSRLQKMFWRVHKHPETALTELQSQTRYLGMWVHVYIVHGFSGFLCWRSQSQHPFKVTFGRNENRTNWLLSVYWVRFPGEMWTNTSPSQVRHQSQRK